MSRGRPAADAAADYARARLGVTLEARWRLDSLIGIGGMAAVYAATGPDGVTGAAKVMHGEFVHLVSVRERFIREASITERVKHPGRVEIFDGGTAEDGEPYFVMELLEGESLFSHWKALGRKVPV